MVNLNHIKAVNSMEIEKIRDEIIELISASIGIDQQKPYNYGKEKSLLDAAMIIRYACMREIVWMIWWRASRNTGC